jgi:hypothetical protein
MNNKGQMGVGAFVMLAVTVIVGLTLLSGGGGIAGQSAALSSTSPIVNETVTMAAANGYLDRPNCVNYGGAMTLYNRSGDGTDTVPTTNYTITTRVSPTTGNKVLTIKTASQSIYAGQAINLSYTCLQQGYAEDSSVRAITPLILLFSALAIAVVALAAVLKNRIWE